MKIKTLTFSLVLLAITAVFISCNNDDDGGGGTPFVEADRTEQQAEDNAEIQAYLSSHYYNSSFFETGTDHKYTDIIITELEEGESVPDGHTILSEAVQTRNVTYLETYYEYYVLTLNQGQGDSPRFTDFVRVRYEGSSISAEVGGVEEVFDSAITPADFYLQTDFNNINAVIKAWQLVMPSFNAGTFNGIDPDTGSISYSNPGLGVMFIPSGLAYFSGSATGSSYDNLIFKFELLQFETMDHDNDGIPSYVEDLNNNLDLLDDDTDEDGIPNFIDNNDDGDLVLTIDELIPNTYIIDTNNGEVEPTLSTDEYERSRYITEGIITLKTVTIADSNNDGPDYLDETIETNYNLPSN
ncbi:FKBP-type peptidyl-prolyl cis-trans isomerase [Winogradskyella forsetii]|uniref:FKBP-type peptidyl-prolyl cis-trans isomerase n=1 Tax=Winogradskyella forsetii TaxID=2686077 RepID=UPI0015B8B0B1|nr:hypothetical protein [Winogradskyella forsetii]